MSLIRGVQYRETHIVIFNTWHHSRTPGVVNCTNRCACESLNSVQLHPQKKFLVVIMKIMYFWQENCQPRHHKERRGYGFKWLPHLKHRINDLQTYGSRVSYLCHHFKRHPKPRYHYEFVSSIQKIRYALSLLCLCTLTFEVGELYLPISIDFRETKNCSERRDHAIENTRTAFCVPCLYNFITPSQCAELLTDFDMAKR